MPDLDLKPRAEALRAATVDAAGKIVDQVRAARDAATKRAIERRVPRRVARPGRPLAIRHVDPRSVAGATAFVATAGVLGCWIAAFVFWVIGSMLGAVGSVEHFLHSVGFTGFHFMSLAVIAGCTLVSITAVVTVTAISTLMTVAYNYYAESFDHLVFEVDDGGEGAERLDA